MTKDHSGKTPFRRLCLSPSKQDTNMNGLLLLFYCLEILAARLCGADGTKENTTSLSTAQSSISASTSPDLITAETSEASSLRSSETFTTVSVLSSSRSPAATSVPPPKTTTTSTTVAPHWGTYRRECHALYLVSGGLIIVCTVLLVSSLMLTCKVRHLSRRLQALSGDADLISNSEFWMGSARRNKSRSGPEAKETKVLMTDFSQTQESDGANKEEGRKVSVDGQTGEENKKKLEENGDESKKETPDTEKSLSSKPQEEATDPKSSKAEADSSTEV
ncbi:unnamed protein product [Pleuronectes platessa]|uniref:Uncharacterized protein n=1 Tax=Pleuronectes platessa TaxID=8262 RepID=A0A9N7YDP4_PLEPL|nr:unnamed protein product [Pleuronectes platessa]